MAHPLRLVRGMARDAETAGVYRLSSPPGVLPRIAGEHRFVQDDLTLSQHLPVGQDRVAGSRHQDVAPHNLGLVNAPDGSLAHYRSLGPSGLFQFLQAPASPQLLPDVEPDA